MSSERFRRHLARAVRALTLTSFALTFAVGCAGPVEVVSQSTGGVFGAAPSSNAALSADGRYVAFESAAKLAPGATPESVPEVYLRDMQERTTVLVSTDHSESMHAVDPSISADGRWVAFTRLWTQDFQVSHVYLWDRLTGETRRLSEAADGTAGDRDSSRAEVSADGRVVVFDSLGTNLVPGDTNGADDVFLYDREAGSLARVSVATSGEQADGGAPTVSSDGRFVSFASRSVVLGATADGDLFVRDRQLGTTERVVVGEYRHQPLWARFDASGSRLLYIRYGWCFSLPPLPPCTAPPHELWTLDRATGVAAPLVLDADQAGSSVPEYSWTSNGDLVAFTTKQALVPEDTNAARDVYLADLPAGAFRLASTAADGTPANASSNYAAISADGAFLAFASSATNLIEGAVPPGIPQLYRKDLDTDG